MVTRAETGIADLMIQRCERPMPPLEVSPRTKDRQAKSAPNQSSSAMNGTRKARMPTSSSRRRKERDIRWARMSMRTCTSRR